MFFFFFPILLLLLLFLFFLFFGGDAAAAAAAATAPALALAPAATAAAVLDGVCCCFVRGQNQTDTEPTPTRNPLFVPTPPPSHTLSYSSQTPSYTSHTMPKGTPILRASLQKKNKQICHWGNPWSRGRTSDSQLSDPGSIPARSKIIFLFRGSSVEAICSPGSSPGQIFDL